MEHCSSRRESDCPPPQSPGQYPWLVNLSIRGGNSDQMFCTIKPPLMEGSVFVEKRRIPELTGKFALACCHGWLVLCHCEDPLDLLLWNPITFESIQIPRLTLKLRGKMQIIEYDDCFLTSPPSDPDSMLVLFTHRVTSMFFCRLLDKRWSQTWYGRQIKDVCPFKWEFLKRPVLCNGKIYAVTDHTAHLVSIDTINTNNRPEARPLQCQKPPYPYPCVGGADEFLVESCGELFTVFVKFKEDIRLIVATFIFKLDFSTMTWVKVESTKDRVFFLDRLQLFNFSCRAIDSQTDGGYIHLINDQDNAIYSYNVEDKTMFRSTPFGAESQFLLWLMPQSRDDYVDHRYIVVEDEGGPKDNVLRRMRNMNGSMKDVEKTELNKTLNLLDLPSDILKRILVASVPVECLNFRATSKLCRSLVPSIPWKASPVQLQACSLISPWLVFSDEDKGIIVFVDPKLDHRYYVTLPEFVGNALILSSKYGWLLIAKDRRTLLFLNPFTRCSVDLPELLPDFSVRVICSCGFSSPPTSSDCIVVIFSIRTVREIHFTSPGLGGWRKVEVGLEIPYEPWPISSPVFCGQHFYLVDQSGKLGVFRNGPHFTWEVVVSDPPKTHLRISVQRFLVECDNDLLLVCMGPPVIVLKLNQSTLAWETIKSLGDHMIFYSASASVSAVAKIPEMKNKIYFSRYIGVNVVYYSLDTCKYQTFGAEEESVTSLRYTTAQMRCSWIEPSWRS